jgi:hypothetical protein
MSFLLQRVTLTNGHDTDKAPTGLSLCCCCSASRAACLEYLVIPASGLVPSTSQLPHPYSSRTGINIG